MPAQKRRAPPAAPKAQEPPSTRRRRSTRISSAGAKSRYFEGASDEDEDEDDHSRKNRLGDDDDGSAALATNGASRKKSKKAKTAPPQKGRPRGRPAKKEAAAADSEESTPAQEEDDDDEYAEEEEEGDDGVKNKQEEEEDDYELGEDEVPRVTFTPHIKLRDTDGVPYANDRLHKNTLLFLKDLKANNNRPWLKANDKEYRRSLDDWNTYVETLMEKIICVDPSIPELPLKDVVFRIYRDIRFSNDPTPYKPHYSVSFSRTGRKGPYACYYIHCQPGGASFVGGGLWQPDAGHLAKLRAHIDARPKKWRKALGDIAFRETFLSGAKKGDAEDCIKAFAAQNKENALKTKPKGFDADHRDITLLKLRDFTVLKKVPDSVFTAPDGQAQICRIIKALSGLVSFLNGIVMPDPDMDSDSSSSEDEEA